MMPVKARWVLLGHHLHVCGRLFHGALLCGHLLCVLLLGAGGLPQRAWAQDKALGEAQGGDAGLLRPGNAAFAAMARAVAARPALDAYRNHATIAEGLAAAITAWCDGKPADPRPALTAAERSFAALTALHYGPVLDGFGPARIRFWPDSRGTGARQLRQLLATADPAALTPQRVAEASVAVTDLITLRRLLDTPAQSQRCAYASAVAIHQAALARQLHTQALAFVAIAGAPGPDNPLYPAGRDAARDVYKSLFATTDFVITRLLEPALGVGPDAIQPRALEAEATGQSGAMIAARLRTLQTILTAEGGFGTLLDRAGLGPLAAGLAAEYGALAQAFESLPPDLAAFLKTPDGWAAVDALRKRLQDQRLVLATTIARTLGLGQGFNASDGD